MLEAYKTQTEQLIAQLDDDIRKITKNLGFNIYVLPRDQNLADFYANDFGEKTMPQSLVQRLADSKDIITIQHLRPALIRKIDWPEQNLQLILMGVSGVVPWTHRQNAKVPLAEAVPPGKINLGHLLADQAGLEVGSNVVLRGEAFSVQEIYEPRGTKDDITAWIDLATAQRMLELPERINLIQALECNCASIDRLAEIEAEISNVLGSEVQIIELATKAIARAKARTDVKANGQRKLSTLRRATLYGFGLLTVVSSLILAMMFLRNALQRVGEIGILRAIGVTRNQIALLFVSKAFVLGIVGGIVGFAAGVACLAIFGPIILNDGFTWPTVPSSLPLLVMIGTPVITMLATWIPIEFVTGRDPARILQAAS
jgi:ABC-type lipoprotein release transport system permease subunit